LTNSGVCDIIYIDESTIYVSIPHQVERKVRIMEERDTVTTLLVFFIAVVLILGGIVIADMTRDSNCIRWYENTGGDFKITNWGCEVRINEDTYIPYRDLDENLTELDLSYIK